MRNISSHPLPPPPPPPPPSCFYGYSTRSVLLCVSVPLVLVSLAVFALDSGGYASWLSSYSRSSTVEARGSGGVLLASSSTSFGGGSNGSDEGLVEFQNEVINSSDQVSYFSLPPTGAMSPAPGPVSLLQYAFSISFSLLYIYFFSPELSPSLLFYKIYPFLLPSVLNFYLHDIFADCLFNGTLVFNCQKEERREKKKKGKEEEEEYRHVL